MTKTTIEEELRKYRACNRLFNAGMCDMYCGQCAHDMPMELFDAFTKIVHDLEYGKYDQEVNE